MDKVIIRIRQLGAIRDSVVTISPMMVFSGESGLGKSYVALLVHYLYRTILEDNRLAAFFTQLGNWEYESMIAEKPSANLTFSIEDLEAWLSSDCVDYLKKIVGNKDLVADISIHLPSYKQDVVTCSYKKDEFVASNKEISSTLFEMDKYSLRVGDGVRKLGVIPWAYLLEDLLKDLVFHDDYLEQTFTMVPGRGALLNVDSKSQESIKAGAGMYSEFLNDWSVVKDAVVVKEGDKDLSQWLKEINGGTIIQKDDSIFLQIDKDQLLPISAAASSTKELAPLAMLFEKYKASKLSILFEEPEAHLHPSKQIAMADFIVEAVSRGAHMQITTHSDYFIRRVNDRIMLHLIKEKNLQLFNELCPKCGIDGAVTLDPSLVSAYLLKRNGKGDVVIVNQSMGNGIPYDSFHEVLVKDFNASMEINRTYKEIRND